MRYIVRFVVWFYDEFDTTLCDIYDIALSAQSEAEAQRRAEERLALEPKHANPGRTEFIGIVSNRADYENLPKDFCSNGQTFFTINMDKDNTSACVLSDLL